MTAGLPFGETVRPGSGETQGRQGAKRWGSRPAAGVDPDPGDEIEADPTVPKPKRRTKGNPRRTILLLKGAIWVAGLAPILWLGVGFFQRSLGINPVEKIIHIQGRVTLILLLATLAVTPIRRLTGWNRIIQLRRLLGLFAFAHACIHFLSYAGLEQLFALSYILADVRDRRYITVGFAGLVLLVPLAVTSTKGWIRRLGKRWQRLHRLAYPATALGVLHYFWKVRADTFWPVVAALVLAALLAVRVVYRKKRVAKGDRRTAHGRKSPRAQRRR